MPADTPPQPTLLGRADFAHLVAAVKATIAETLAVPALLDGVAARKYLGLSKSAWFRARSAGQIPSPVHVEGAGDRYRKADLDKCVERLKPRRKLREK